MSRTIYINRKDDYGNLETVDEFSVNDFKGRISFLKYAKEMLKEYRLSDRSAHYYMSQKACKDWYDYEVEEVNDECLYCQPRTYC
jgi:hypothetical protein